MHSAVSSFGSAARIGNWSKRDIGSWKLFASGPVLGIREVPDVPFVAEPAGVRRQLRAITAGIFNNRFKGAA
jgi:hypothetical protein